MLCAIRALSLRWCGVRPRFATGKGVASLMNVLKAYAALDPEVGYCQVGADAGAPAGRKPESLPP